MKKGFEEAKIAQQEKLIEQLKKEIEGYKIIIEAERGYINSMGQK